MMNKLSKKVGISPKIMEKYLDKPSLGVMFESEM